MNTVIRDMKDMTDSRELMEAKAHPVISIFLYILVALIVIALVWSYFGEIDIVVKGNGVVRPNEKVSSIKNKVAGKVSKVFYKPGQKVKKGDFLFTLESKDLDVEVQALQAEYDKVKAELAALRDFQARVLNPKDTASLDSMDVKDFPAEQVTLQKLLLALNSNKTEREQIATALGNMQLLEQSIRQGLNLFTESENEYFNKAQDYEIKTRKLENVIKQREEAYVLVTKTADIEDVKVSKQQFDDAKLDLKNYKNEFQLNLRTAIEESQRKLQSITLERDKIVVEINSSIQSSDAQLKQLEDQLQVTAFSTDDREIKASVDGIMNVLTELREGELIQAGTEIATIVPEFNSEYTVQVALPNKDIAKIKSGDLIKYQFQALPYKEYGELIGTVTTVGADAIVDQQNGTSFYAVEATIVNKPLYNSKGEVANIKSGMLAEANVVTSSKKILYYLLEKIDLKE
jgi:HlyD family type I secretion membrane fusion protein